MSEVVCASCGSQQVEGSAYCALCGRQFPRTGWLDESQDRTPMFVSDPVPSVVYAGVGRRFLATAIDGAAIGLVVGLVLLIGTLVAGGAGALLPFTSAASVLGLGMGVGLWFWQGRSGATLGNTLLKIRVVDQATRTPTGVVRAMVWWLLLGASSIVPVLGPVLVLLSPGFDAGPTRQGWLDRIARVVAVDIGAAGSSVATVEPWTAAPGPAPDPWSAAATGEPVAGYPAQPGYDPRYTVPPQYAQPAPRYAEPAPAPQPADPAWPGQSPVAQPWQEPVAAAQPWQTPAPPAAPAPPVPAAGPAWSAAPAPWEPPAPAAAGIAAVATAPPPPGWGVSAAPAPTSAMAFTLQLDSGEIVTVGGPTLVGRNPQAPDATGWTLVSLDDPTRSVSKTHLELGVDTDGLWVCDRGSTNGTIVSTPGHPPRVASPGTRVRVPADSVLHVGDRRVAVRAGAA